MKIIQPQVKKIKTQSELGLDGIFHDIAEAAKICYQTTETKLSDREFVEMLIKKDHGRCLEFGTVYLQYSERKHYDHNAYATFLDIQKSPYTHWYINCNNEPYLITTNITTNLRVIYDLWRIDNNPLEILDEKFWLWHYLCEPTDTHERRYTYDFICSRGCGDDFRTHTIISWLMESTRYCNYSKDKFNNELTFIVPDFEKNALSRDVIIEVYKKIEVRYKALLKNEQPQYAKNILPLGIKCQLRGCGFRDAWENFDYRRNSIAAYPECEMLAKQILF